MGIAMTVYGDENRTWKGEREKREEFITKERKGIKGTNESISQGARVRASEEWGKGGGVGCKLTSHTSMS
jgi:hypothetical protein